MTEIKRLRKALEDPDLAASAADWENKVSTELSDNLLYGCQVTIEWEPWGEFDEAGIPEWQPESDRGFLTALPGDDGFMVHPWESGVVCVPYPNNEGGKDAAPAEWRTLSELVANRQVKRILLWRPSVRHQSRRMKQ